MWELLVGWRYLYRGHRSPVVMMGLLLSLLTAGLGAALFLVPAKPSPPGVLILTLGAVGLITFALLRLFSVFTAVSVGGVVLGVAALTVVLSVTSGFQAVFRDKVLGVNAHVLVMKNAGDFENYRDVEEMARSTRYVVAVEPFVFQEMQITRGKGQLSIGAVKGVDPQRVTQVLDLAEHMIDGSVEALKVRPAEGEPPAIIVGRDLANKIKAKVGDVVTLVVPLSNIDFKTWTHSGRPPKTKKFVVRGIFYSGFNEYDSRLTYADLADVQSFMEQGDSVLGVEMRLSDVDKASWVAAKLDKQLGGDPFTVTDWQQLNKNLFTALKLQKVALLVILTLIFIVAAFNMVSALTMMVFDKTKEIAILRSMGTTSTGVARVFQIVGLIIGGVGTAIGLGLGLMLCEVVARFGYPLDPKVYLIDRLPIVVQPTEIIILALATMAVSLGTTLYPAFKASALQPVEGLRYD
jgi:lipoprotein-releasing system permease protein